MRLATWNVNPLAVRPRRCWPGWRRIRSMPSCCRRPLSADDKFPHAEIEAAGYRAQWHGQKTYNGVALR